MAEADAVECLPQSRWHFDLPLGLPLDHALYDVGVDDPLALGNSSKNGAASRTTISETADELRHLLVVICRLLGSLGLLPAIECPT